MPGSAAKPGRELPRHGFRSTRRSRLAALAFHSTDNVTALAPLGALEAQSVISHNLPEPRCAAMPPLPRAQGGLGRDGYGREACVPGSEGVAGEGRCIRRKNASNSGGSSGGVGLFMSRTL